MCSFLHLSLYIYIYIWVFPRSLTKPDYFPGWSSSFCLFKNIMYICIIHIIMHYFYFYFNDIFIFCWEKKYILLYLCILSNICGTLASILRSKFCFYYHPCYGSFGKCISSLFNTYLVCLLLFQQNHLKCSFKKEN